MVDRGNVTAGSDKHVVWDAGADAPDTESGCRIKVEVTPLPPPWDEVGIGYVEVDSSEDAVRRFSKKRNIRSCTLGTLNRLKIRGSFDLIVCSDVLHYVPDSELKKGLRAMSHLLGGVAFLECFTKEDETIGDKEGFYARPASTYRQAFKEAGFVSLGMHFYAGNELEPSLTSLERSR